MYPSSLPNIDLQVLPTFPANVVATGAVDISKSGPTYTFGLNFQNVAEETNVSDMSKREVLVQDTDTGAFWRVKLTNLPNVAAGAVDALIPQEFVVGLTLSNNSSDPNNKIDIAPGRARGNGVTVDNPTTITVALGAVAPNTTYHIHALRNNVTGNFWVTADVSPTSPSVVPGYTRVQRIGAIMTDGSGNIRPFVQDGNKFFFNATGGIIDYSGGLRAKAPLTCTLPNGVRVEGLFSATIAASNGDAGVNMSLYDGENPNIRATVYDYASAGANSLTVPASIFTNSSRQIQLEVGGSAHGSLPCVFRTLGWVDYQIPRIGA